MSSKFLHILNNSNNDVIDDLDIFPFKLDIFKNTPVLRSQNENVLVIAKTGVGKMSLLFMVLIIVLKKIKKLSIYYLH